MISGIGPKDHLSQYGIQCKVDSPNVGQNLRDHPILPHVFKIKDGIGLDAHLLRAGYMKEAAVRAYQKDHKGPLHSGLLELVGFPRIDKRLNANPDYVKLKEANGGLDPFGPDGQPHFEIDFVVSAEFHFIFPSKWNKLDKAEILLANVRRRLSVALSNTCHGRPSHCDRGSDEASFEAGRGSSPIGILS